jgi:hypothetical protein
LLALDDALQWLEKTDPRKGQLIEMRYFGGMTAEESAMALSIPVHVVRRELRLAQAWLRKEMAGENSGADTAVSRRGETGGDPSIPYGQPVRESAVNTACGGL